MTPEEVIAQVKKRAKHNFKTGLNCAESVFEARYLSYGYRPAA